MKIKKNQTFTNEAQAKRLHLTPHFFVGCCGVEDVISPRQIWASLVNSWRSRKQMYWKVSREGSTYKSLLNVLRIILESISWLKVVYRSKGAPSTTRTLDC